MASDIILEHIDVIVIGPKKYEFIELILQKDLFIKNKNSNVLSSPISNHISKKNQKSYNRHKSIQNSQKQKLKNQSKQKSGYLEILSSFLPSSKKYLKSQFEKNNSHQLISQNKKKEVFNKNNIIKTQNRKGQISSPSKQSHKQSTAHHSKQKKKHHHSHQQFAQNTQSHQKNSQVVPVSSQLLINPNSSSPRITHSVSNKFCGIKKFSKVIQTSTFWITINFFIFDMKIYDPILSQYSKGNISICIMVDQDQNQQLLLSQQNEQDVQVQAEDEQTGNGNGNNLNNTNQNNENLANNPNNNLNDSNQLKNYMAGNTSNSNFNYNYNYITNNFINLNLKQNQNQNQSQQTKQTPLKIVKNQIFLQSKILSRFHVPIISGFSSLLKIKLTQQNRLIQESNNLRLSNNQVFRWIVDCYFQNKYRIKLKQSLGDQIQKGESSFFNNGNGNVNNGSKSKASGASGYECQIM